MIYIRNKAFKTIKIIKTITKSKKIAFLQRELTHDFGEKLAFSFKVFFSKGQDIYYEKISFARHEHDIERTPNRAGL